MSKIIFSEHICDLYWQNLKFFLASTCRKYILCKGNKDWFLNPVISQPPFLVFGFQFCFEPISCVVLAILRSFLLRTEGLCTIYHLEAVFLKLGESLQFKSSIAIYINVMMVSWVRHYLSIVHPSKFCKASSNPLAHGIICLQVLPWHV